MHTLYLRLHICPSSSTDLITQHFLKSFLHKAITKGQPAHSECTVQSLYILYTMSVKLLLQYNQITGTIKSQMFRTRLLICVIPSLNIDVSLQNIICLCGTVKQHGTVQYVVSRCVRTQLITEGWNWNHSLLIQQRVFQNKKYMKKCTDTF